LTDSRRNILVVCAADKRRAGLRGVSPEIRIVNEQILIGPWREVEIPLTADTDHENPYTQIEVGATFHHAETGTRLYRPAFYDGERTWKIRFAAPTTGVWEWRTEANIGDGGLSGVSGQIVCTAAGPTGNRFYDRGFWRMSPGGRNLVHADGTPCLLVGDTAWALPWRATVEQGEIYAADRQAKGFNAALLMTVQPDRDAKGPRSRTEDEGFEVGFEDLPDGHLNEINIAYFQYFDRLTEILVAHEICPVYQPVFHGYGWKGLRVAGPDVPAEEYARYCRYLVARYGARPAIWLVGGDGNGYHSQIGAGGEIIEKEDAYQQPTGIHYCPHADNRAYQDAVWLDFQWCQTGHNGEHLPERVADMWRNLPAKAVANGEPTYENIGKTGRSAGWWQGHEVWCNLCAGGTMGVVYGAGSLWQWKLHRDEPGHQDWCVAPGADWRDALDFEGSQYPGIAARLLDGLPFADMTPNWDYTIGRRGLAIENQLLLVYLENGGGFAVVSEKAPQQGRVYNARTGELITSVQWSPQKRHLSLPEGEPLVVLFAAVYSETDTKAEGNA
jgi:hypothetical protein